MTLAEDRPIAHRQAPDVITEGIDVLTRYVDMLQSNHGRQPGDTKVLLMAFGDWVNGEADSWSGVPLDDLETRLSKVIESLTEDQRTN